MKTWKRTFANVSFFDKEAIEKKLEDMAAKGWMIAKAGNLFWTYGKIPPQKRRFAVTYFPGASEFDPKPSEKQLEKEDLCAQDGWELVLRWDAMQIFCTDREDAVPIETDPVPQVENIHLTMEKNILIGHLPTIVLVLWSLFLQFSQLWRDPVEYLSDTARLAAIPCWLLLLLMVVLELLLYFRWERRARQAAQQGTFLPLRTRKWLSWGVLALAAVFLFLSYSASSARLLLMVCIAAVMVGPMVLGRWMMKKLKEKGVSRTRNRVVSGVCVGVLVMGGMAAVVAAAMGGWIPANDRGSQPVGQYEWNGRIWDIYNDPLPLEVEDLADVDARWSKEARLQESPLAAYGDYRQDLLYGQEIRGYDLSYEITDVKLPILYDFLKNRLLKERQDEAHDDFVFVDHFEPVDAAPWGAEEAYQLHWSDSVLDTYLVCWENRIVEITFYWQPTQEQIQMAAECLKPDNETDKEAFCGSKELRKGSDTVS